MYCLTFVCLPSDFPEVFWQDVFNSLAVGMSPDNVIAGPIVMVLIFVIGHAINIFMNVLGAMVHPMRLTFVEFFKNSGTKGAAKSTTSSEIENLKIKN